MNKTILKATTALGLTAMIGGAAVPITHAQGSGAAVLADCVIQNRPTCPPAADPEIAAAAQIVADQTGISVGEAEQRIRDTIGAEAGQAASAGTAQETPATEPLPETTEPLPEADAAQSETLVEPLADATEPLPETTGEQAGETALAEQPPVEEEAATEAPAKPQAEAEAPAEPQPDAGAAAQAEAETPAEPQPETVGEAASDTLDEAMQETGEAAEAITGQQTEPATQTEADVVPEEPLPRPETEAAAETEAETGTTAETQAGAAAEAEAVEDVPADDLDAAMQAVTEEEQGAAETDATAETEADTPAETEMETEAATTAPADDLDAAMQAVAEEEEGVAGTDAAAEAEAGAATAAAGEEEVDQAARAERRAQRRERQMQAEALEATGTDIDAEADAGTGAAAGTAPADVQTETVTEQTARSSDEDVAPATADQGTDELLRTILGVGAGVAIGMLIDDGDRIVERRGDRVVIERDGELVVLRDENQLLRRPGTRVRTRTFDDGSTRTVIIRDNGVRIVTVRAPDGAILYRARVQPDGERIVLIDERQAEPVDLDRLPRFPDRRPVVVEYRDSVDPQAVREVFVEREPVIERSYSLQQVRDVRELRELMPRIDLDAINFATGSAAIPPSEARELTALGRAMAQMIDQDPDEIFLIEGHTDTVGSAAANLALSDRRAESVALALTEYFDVPPENMITQGYGERYLKVEQEGDVAENRRAAVRRITPLIRTAAAR